MRMWLNFVSQKLCFNYVKENLQIILIAFFNYHLTFTMHNLKIDLKRKNNSILLKMLGILKIICFINIRYNNINKQHS